MPIGHARVSTSEQNLDLQIDALEAAGYEQVNCDEIIGAKAERPGLKEALDFVRRDDTSVVWRLDWLGRSLKDLVVTLEDLQTRGIGIQESVLRTQPVGHGDMAVSFPRAATYGTIFADQNASSQKFRRFVMSLLNSNGCEIPVSPICEMPIDIVFTSGSTLICPGRIEIACPLL